MYFKSVAVLGVKCLCLFIWVSLVLGILCGSYVASQVGRLRKVNTSREKSFSNGRYSIKEAVGMPDPFFCALVNTRVPSQL